MMEWLIVKILPLQRYSAPWLWFHGVRSNYPSREGIQTLGAMDSRGHECLWSVSTKVASTSHHLQSQW